MSVQTSLLRYMRVSAVKRWCFLEQVSRTIIREEEVLRGGGREEVV